MNQEAIGPLTEEQKSRVRAFNPDCLTCFGRDHCPRMFTAMHGNPKSIAKAKTCKRMPYPDERRSQ